MLDPALGPLSFHHITSYLSQGGLCSAGKTTAPKAHVNIWAASYLSPHPCPCWSGGGGATAVLLQLPAPLRNISGSRQIPNWECVRQAFFNPEDESTQASRAFLGLSGSSQNPQKCWNYVWLELERFIPGFNPSELLSKEYFPSTGLVRATRAQGLSLAPRGGDGDRWCFHIQFPRELLPGHNLQGWLCLWFVLGSRRVARHGLEVPFGRCRLYKHVSSDTHLLHCIKTASLLTYLVSIKFTFK